MNALTRATVAALDKRATSPYLAQLLPGLVGAGIGGLGGALLPAGGSTKRRILQALAGAGIGGAAGVGIGHAVGFDTDRFLSGMKKQPKTYNNNQTSSTTVSQIPVEDDAAATARSRAAAQAEENRIVDEANKARWRKLEEEGAAASRKFNEETRLHDTKMRAEREARNRLPENQLDVNRELLSDSTRRHQADEYLAGPEHKSILTDPIYPISGGMIGTGLGSGLGLGLGALKLDSVFRNNPPRQVYTGPLSPPKFIMPKIPLTGNVPLMGGFGAGAGAILGAGAGFVKNHENQAIDFFKKIRSNK